MDVSYKKWRELGGTRQFSSVNSVIEITLNNPSDSDIIHRARYEKPLDINKIGREDNNYGSVNYGSAP